jgi:hypothetical protein
MSVTTGPQMSLAPVSSRTSAGYVGHLQGRPFHGCGLTLFASIAAIWLAYFNHNLGTLTAIQQAAQQSVFDPMNTIVKLGLGVILGLIGGRTNSNHEAARTVQRASSGLARLLGASAPRQLPSLHDADNLTI